MRKQFHWKPAAFKYPRYPSRSLHEHPSIPAIPDAVLSLGACMPVSSLKENDVDSNSHAAITPTPLTPGGQICGYLEYLCLIDSQLPGYADGMECSMRRRGSRDTWTRPIPRPRSMLSWIRMRSGIPRGRRVCISCFHWNFGHLRPPDPATVWLGRLAMKSLLPLSTTVCDITCNINYSARSYRRWIKTLVIVPPDF